MKSTKLLYCIDNTYVDGIPYPTYTISFNTRSLTDWHMENPLHKLLSEYIEGDEGRELFVFSGNIEKEEVAEMQNQVEQFKNKDKKASLFLTTFGGDAHEAYRLIQCVKSSFSEIRLLLFGNCKSAGTLVAIGADELAFGPRGELGPLDVQVRPPDEIYRLSSGLDIFQAVHVVTTLAERTFGRYMLNLVKSGISTRTASEIASNLAGRLFEPITAQIDPLRIGEAERAMRIAEEYGNRIGLGNLKQGALNQLTRSYPSHHMVIDEYEAKKIFKKVGSMTERELEIACFWEAILISPSADQAYTFAGRSLLPPPSPVEEQPESDENESLDRGGDTGTDVHRGSEEGIQDETQSENNAPAFLPES